MLHAGELSVHDREMYAVLLNGSIVDTLMVAKLSFKFANAILKRCAALNFETGERDDLLDGVRPGCRER